MPAAPSSHVKAAAPRVKGSFTMRAVNQAPIGSSSGSRDTSKKRKHGASRAAHSDDSDDDDDGDIADVDDDQSEGDDEEADTDDEISAAHNAGKSKKTAKRKRRATSPTTFGEALSGLLGGPAASTSRLELEHADDACEERQTQTAHAVQQPTILSLAPHIRRSAQSSRLNAKAARLALDARRKREDRAHVTDIIGGWGAPGEPPKTTTGEAKAAPEELDDAQKMADWLSEGGTQGYEKRLRKAAQRGVVKLFNAIRAAQSTNQEDLVEQHPVPAAKDSNSSKTLKSVPTAADSSNVSLKKGDNALGGKARAVSELSKNNFFDLIRAGTTSQRA